MTLISRFRDKSFNVFLWGLVLVAVLHSFTIAKYFLLSGYWDDTILFVRLIERAPSNPIHALPWILNQPGDLNGPLLLTLLYGLNITGLLSNYSLILLSNLALVALLALLVHIAIKLGAPAGLSCLSGALLYFAPVLVEQRTWFVAIQHTLTVLFSVAACYLTYSIASVPNSARRRSINRLVLLDLTLILVALGRETGLVLSVVVIGVVGVVRPRHFKVLALGWLIPSVVLIHRFISGREGTHVQRILRGFTNEMPSTWGLAEIGITPTQLVLLCAIAIPVIQTVVLPRNRSTQQRVVTAGNAEQRRASAGTTALISGVWLVLVQFPATGVSFVALLPPFSATGSEKLAFGRWSQFGFDAGTYHFVVAFVIAIALYLGSQSISVLLAFTLLCTAPYLAPGSGIISVVSERPTDTLSRYAVYSVPAVYFVLNELLRKVRATYSHIFGRSTPYLLILLPLWFVPQAFRLDQLLQQRSSEFSSFVVESCSSGSYMVLSETTEGFVTNEYTRVLVSDPALALLNDSKLKSQFPDLDAQIVTQSDVLQYCFDDLPIESLVERIGVFSGAQVQLDNLIAEIPIEDEEALRAGLKSFLDGLIQSGVVRPTP